MLIDELPFLRAPFIQAKPDTMRKYGITAALDGANALRNHPHSMDPIKVVDGICDVKVLFATEDEQTQKMGERILGATTQFDRGYDADGAAGQLE